MPPAPTKDFREETTGPGYMICDPQHMFLFQIRIKFKLQSIISLKWHYIPVLLLNSFFDRDMPLGGVFDNTGVYRVFICLVG
jgi:hypothetical protein